MHRDQNNRIRLDEEENQNICMRKRAEPLSVATPIKIVAHGTSSAHVNPKQICQFDFLFFGGWGTSGLSHLSLSLRLCRCILGFCWSPVAIALDIVLLRRPANTRFCMTENIFFFETIEPYHETYIQNRFASIFLDLYKFVSFLRVSIKEPVAVLILFSTARALLHL